MSFKCTVPGHTYLLPLFDKPEAVSIIQFIHKEPVKEGSTDMKTIKDGITNEQLLEILEDRLTFLNEKFSSRENSIAITKIQEARMWLEKRTADRKKRGVEGTHQK